MVRLAWCLAWFWVAVDFWADSEAVLGFVAFIMVVVGVPFTIYGINADIDGWQQQRSKGGQFQRRRNNEEEEED
jgi:glucose uptake protein GlcU